MAIVKMNKITIVGLEKNKESVMYSLMKMGAVEIVNVETERLDGENAGLVAKDGDEAEVSAIEAGIARIKSALDYLSKYNSSKRRLFEPKRAMDHKDYSRIVENQEKLWNVVEQIDRYDERLSALRAEENRLLNTIVSLEPWKTLNFPLEVSSTASTAVYIGVVPAPSDTDRLRDELYAKVPDVHFEVIGIDREQAYLFIICHKASGEDVLSVLKQYGFSRSAFKDMKGTPESNITLSNGRLREIAAERSQ
jgi:V/A-type H+-transporting ATPase subunit I